MRSLANIFGKSPFNLLLIHMEKVASCVEKLPEILKTYEEGKQNKVESQAKEISKLEHYADMTKNDIRNSLPSSLFLAISRTSLLEILAIQDAIADKAEDIAILLTFKHVELEKTFFQKIESFLQQNISCFLSTQKIINELEELLEFSFGGVEAEKVRSMIDQVAYEEHQVDIIQREILKELFNMSTPLSGAEFSLIHLLLKEIASLSDLAENLANRIRMTLEIK